MKLFANIMYWTFTGITGLTFAYVVFQYTLAIIAWFRRLSAMSSTPPSQERSGSPQTGIPSRRPIGNPYKPMNESDWQYDDDGVYEPFWD